MPGWSRRSGDPRGSSPGGRRVLIDRPSRPARIGQPARIARCTLVAGLAALALGGCAGAARVEERSPGAPTLQGEERPLAAGPYDQRAGTEADSTRPIPRRVVFRAPAAEARPTGAHPRYLGPVRVAVVFVEGGELKADPQALLELDALLGDERELLVTGLPLGTQPPGAEPEVLDLSGLAQLAHGESRDLLLVDVRARPGEAREAFFVDARSGSLLARHRIEPPAAPVTALEPDAVDRLVAACLRLRR